MCEGLRDMGVSEIGYKVCCCIVYEASWSILDLVLRSTAVQSPGTLEP